MFLIKLLMLPLIVAVTMIQCFMLSVSAILFDMLVGIIFILLCGASILHITGDLHKTLDSLGV